MRLRNIVSIAGYGLLVLITMDICARIDDAANEGAPFFAKYNINTLFRPSEFGREGKPGAKFGKWSINSLGYRGPEPQPDRVNVATFGASETFGLYEDPAMDYPRTLERLLNSAHSAKFNVINMALPGVRIGRTGYLVNGIKKTTAKVVIIYPSPSNYIGVSEPLCGKQTKSVPNEVSILELFRITGKMEALIKKYLPAQVLTAVREVSIWQHTRKSPPIARVPESTISAFSMDLECATRAAREAGSEVILVAHATYFGSELRPSDSAMMTAWRRFYPELSESGFIDLEERSNASIKAVAARVGVRFVDVREMIRGGPENFADFVHFTNAGASKMAAALVDAVVNEVVQ